MRRARLPSISLKRPLHIPAFFAHRAQNVSFAPQNVNCHRPANRSQTAGRRLQSAQRRHSLGDRNSCLGDRNSCRPNSVPQIASPPACRRDLFLALNGQNFYRFNQNTREPSFYDAILSKPNAPCLRYFRPSGFVVTFVPLLAVNKCKNSNCTPVGNAPCERGAPCADSLQTKQSPPSPPRCHLPLGGRTAPRLARDGVS